MIECLQKAAVSFASNVKDDKARQLLVEEVEGCVSVGFTHSDLVVLVIEGLQKEFDNKT